MSYSIDKNGMNYKRHFWLYAKGWYARNTENVLEDMASLCEHYSGYRSGWDGLMLFQHLAVEEMLKGSDTSPDVAVNEFIKTLSPHPRYNLDFKTWRDRIVYACCTALGHVSVDKIEGDLGEPDYKILPPCITTIKRLTEEENKK